MKPWDIAEDHFPQWAKENFGFGCEDWRGPPYWLLTPEKLIQFCELREKDSPIPRSELQAAEKERGAINIPDFRVYNRCIEHGKHYLAWVDPKWTQDDLTDSPGHRKLNGYAITSRITNLPAILAVYRGEAPVLSGWYELADRDEYALEDYVVDNKDIQALRDFLSGLVTCNSARAGLK